MEKLITLNIFGQSYTFRAGPEVENADAVAALLEKKIKEIENQKAGNLTEVKKLTILISVALNVTNENINLKNKQSNLMQNLSRKSEKLVQLLDETA